MALSSKLVEPKVGWFLLSMTAKYTTTGPQKTDSNLVTVSVSTPSRFNLIIEYSTTLLAFLIWVFFFCTFGFNAGFKYKMGDSVMVVSEAEYNKCNSTQPNFVSNTGNTVFEVNHSGLFYFISGISRHCVRGQRMIVKVMATDDSPSPANGGGAGGGGNKSAGSRPSVTSFAVSKLVFVNIALFYVASVML